MVRSEDSTAMPASSMAWRTELVRVASHVTCQKSPAASTSSAPASSAANMRSSSSTDDGTRISPLRWNCHATAPGSAMEPPILEKMVRTSGPVRLRLSVRAST